jgi:hypothetical protein
MGSSGTGGNEFDEAEPKVVLADGFSAGDVLIGLDQFLDVSRADGHAIDGDAFDGRLGGLFDGIGDGRRVGHGLEIWVNGRARFQKENRPTQGMQPCIGRFWIFGLCWFRPG